MKDLFRHPTCVLVCLSLLLAGASAPALAAKKTFVYCSEGSPSSFNPQIASDGTSFNASRGIFSRLMEFKYGETNLIAGLAESWVISPDGKTYTFKLRKGVKFHSSATFKPTRDLNAEDVIFSFDRQRLQTHPYHKVSGGAYEYFDSMEMGKVIKNIRALDPYTVVFELTRTEAPFLANLAMDFTAIHSAEYANAMLKAKTPEKLDTDPIGTGPFQFVSYSKDQSIRYVANDSYFHGRPKIDSLVFSITQDPSVRFQKLKAGECHLVTEPSPADLGAMAKDPHIELMRKPGLNVGYLALNVNKAPLNNPLVRQAIGHALNRKSYIQAIYLGNAVVAKNPLPPTIWSHNDAVADIDYNPETSKKLLAQAGLANGFNLEIWTLPVSRPYIPNGKKLGELMQADLAKVGIKVKLVTFDWPTYLEKIKHGEHAACQIGWTGDNGDPDNFLNYLLSCASAKTGQNYSRWCHADYDVRVTKARTLSDKKAREKLYMEAQAVAARELPQINIAHSVVFRAMSKKVTGYQIDPFGGDIFTWVDLK